MSQGRTIKEVLMCEPLHFSVVYSINPWMKPGTVDKASAQREWNVLKKILENLQVKVKTIPQLPNLPDMVFSADQCFIDGKKAIMANFRYTERKQEGKSYEEWFRKNGFVIHHLSGKEYFEGGDIGTYDQIIFLGTGFRSTKAGGKAISRILKKNVVALELTNPFFYHLDTALFILENQTAFYYEGAFSKESCLVLKEIIPNLIPLTKNEALNFCANSAFINGTVIMQKGNDSFKKRIEALGYDTKEVDISEFMKAGGGAHCLLQIIK